MSEQGMQAVGPGDHVTVKRPADPQAWTGRVVGAWPRLVKVTPDMEALGREDIMVQRAFVRVHNSDDAVMLAKAKEALKAEEKGDPRA